ncbi:MAG: hypothetical protein J7L25_01660, partial [Deltaproteobacteria bacterium]|nr:hypothetical protein [Candidatus Tharpella aukensis]
LLLKNNLAVKPILVTCPDQQGKYYFCNYSAWRAVRRFLGTSRKISSFFPANGAPEIEAV